MAVKNFPNKKSVLFGSIIGLLAGYILSNPVEFGMCRSTYSFGNAIGCLDSLGPTIGQVIGLFSLTAVILSVITYLLRKEVFHSWLRFAYWWIPLSAVMVYLASGTSGGGFGIPNIFDQEFVALIFAGFFLLISLLVIVYSSLKYRFQDKGRSFRGVSIVLILLSAPIVFAPFYWLFHALLFGP